MKLPFAAGARHFGHLIGPRTAAANAALATQAEDDEEDAKNARVKSGNGDSGESDDEDEDDKKKSKSRAASDDEDDDGGKKDAPADDEDESMSAAQSRLYRRGQAAGARSERQRCAAIFADAAAGARPDIAAALAFETPLTSAEAIAVLKTAAAGQRPGGMARRMAAIDIPNPGAGAAQDAPKRGSAAGILASYAKALGNRK